MKFLKYVFVAVLSLMLGSAWAQSSATNGATSDASNTGVVLDSGGNTNRSTAWSLLFPSNNAAPSGAKDCTIFGTEMSGIGWNLGYHNAPKALYVPGCLQDQAIEALTRKCQFLTAKIILDQRSGVDVVKVLYSGDEQAYQKEIKETYKNLNTVDCVKFLATPAAPKVEPQEKKEPPPQAPSKPVEPVVIHQLTTEINLGSLTLFPTGKWEITSAGKQRLQEEMSKFKPGTAIVSKVEAHTDDVGSEASNLILSQRRADAMATYLKSLGFEVKEVHGYGESRPLAPGTSVAARAINRRATLSVTQSETDQVAKK